MINFFQKEKIINDVNILIFYQDLINEKFENLKEFEEKNCVEKIIDFFNSKYDQRIFKEKIYKNSKWEILEDFINYTFEKYEIEKNKFFIKDNLFENLKKKKFLELILIFSYLNLLNINWEKICENLENKENLKILEKGLKNILVVFFTENFFKKKIQLYNSKNDFTSDINSTLKILKNNEKHYLEKINILEKSNYENEMKKLKNASLRTIDSELKKDLVYYKEFKKLAENNILNYQKKIREKEKEILKLKNLIELKELKTSRKNINLDNDFLSLKNLKKSLESSILLQKNTEPFFKNKNNDCEKRVFYYKNLSLILIKELKTFYTEFQKFLIILDID